MATLVRDPQPAEFEALLLAILQPLASAAGMTVLGQFNLGHDEHDYRVPDGGLQRDFADRVFYPAAALVLEIVSPGDESWEKLPFYAAHHVGELLIVDPQKETVDWPSLSGEDYEPLDRSALIELGPAQLAERLDWPA
jgi:Uma2 family endonuclease